MIKEAEWPVSYLEEIFYTGKHRIAKDPVISCKILTRPLLSSLCTGSGWQG